MPRLLSRFAEGVFWLGRYVERANSLARVLDVNQTYSYDAQGGRNWQIVLQLNSDEEAFSALYDEATAENVLAFYVTNQRNPSSIRSCLGFARENARTLRPLISTEMWTQLNAFYHRIEKVRSREAAPQALSKLATAIKEGCQTHVGITRETLYRDEAWLFYLAGQQIERADQTTRLLDVKYMQLLPKEAETGSAVDVSQWHALLRAAAGLQAYRRQHPGRTTPSSVAAFMLFDPLFPRSVICTTNEATRALAGLKRTFRVTTGDAARKRLRDFQARLLDMTIDDVLKQGMHEMLDWVQLELSVTTSLIGREFFGLH